jgi:hypothetical protein
LANQSLISELDRWLSAFPERDVERRVAHLEAEWTRLVQQRTQLEARLTAIGDELGKGREALEMRRRWSELAASPLGSDPDAPNGRPLRGRRAIEAVMRATPAKRDWTIQDVHDELLARGWVDGPDTHTTQVNLSRMFRHDKTVERPSYGLYRLKIDDAPQSSAPSG